MARLYNGIVTSGANNYSPLQKKMYLCRHEILKHQKI